VDCSYPIVSRIFRSVLGVTAAVASFTFDNVQADDWPQFRGPHRDGIAQGTDAELVIDADLNDGDPKIAWTAEIGSGFSGPVVVEGRVFLSHRIGDEVIAQAWQANSGEHAWKSPYPTDYRDEFGFDNGPRATPAVASKHLVTYGAEGRLQCYSTETGKPIWDRNLRDELAAAKGFFGRASSPLIIGESVLVIAGGRDASTVSFDLKTGQTNWLEGSEESGYASPIQLDPDTLTSPVLALNREGLEVIEPASGKRLAQRNFRSSMGASVNGTTPVLCGDGRVFLSACYGVGGAMWSVSTDSEGLVSISEDWAAQDRLDCHYATPIFKDGFLYGYHGRQEEGQELRCVDAKNGTVVWQSSRGAGGSVILVGDILLCVTDRGELVTVHATSEAPEGYDSLEISRAQILRAGHRCMPAFADGKLFVRDGKKLVCIDLIKQSTPE